MGPHQVKVQVAGVQVLQSGHQCGAHVLGCMVRVPAAQRACSGISCQQACRAGGLSASCVGPSLGQAAAGAAAGQRLKTWRLLACRHSQGLPSS